MTDMSMNKAIHGAVRRDLSRFSMALQSFPDGNRARARRLLGAWENFDDQLTHHHEGEHAIAWPALESIGVSKDLLATMDAEHDKMAEALASTRSAMTRLSRTATESDAKSALSTMETLQAATFAHLDHEELEFEDLLLSKRESPEVKAMGKAFGRVSPARGGRFFEWVLDGASPDEVAAVKRDVPGPVLTIIGGIFGRGYRKNIAPVWRS